MEREGLSERGQENCPNCPSDQGHFLRLNFLMLYHGVFTLFESDFRQCTSEFVPFHFSDSFFTFVLLPHFDRVIRESLIPR